MKVAVVQFPIWSIKIAPLGMAYISAALKRANHQVDVFDFNLSVFNKIYPNGPEQGMAEGTLWYELGNKTMRYNEESINGLLKVLGPHVHPTVVTLAKGKYDVLGVSLYTSSMKFAELVLKVYRLFSPDTIIVIGGPSSTRKDAEFFIKHDLADYVVVGEGEETIVELLQKIQNKEDTSTVQSIKYKDSNGNIVVTKKRQPMPPENFPLPDFEGIEVNGYTFGSLPIMMSRGCVAACSFCEETFYWIRYRMGVIENITKELENGINKYSPKNIYVCDSLINGDHELLDHLVNFVSEHKIVFSWGSNARFDKRLTKELIFKMKSVGCDFIIFGLESASSKVLKLMNKKIDLDAVYENLNSCKEAGINVTVNILVGFPGEEEEDFQETVNFLLLNRDKIHIVNTGTGMEIVENSPLQRQPNKYGILTDSIGDVVKTAGSWRTVDNLNTHEIRMDRLKRLRDTLRNENILFHPIAYAKES